jgi:hypothetical protein
MNQRNRRSHRSTRPTAAPAPRFVSHFEDQPPTVFDKHYHLAQPYASYLVERGGVTEFSALELSFFAAGEVLSQQHAEETTAETERVKAAPSRARVRGGRVVAA